MTPKSGSDKFATSQCYAERSRIWPIIIVCILPTGMVRALKHYQLDSVARGGAEYPNAVFFCGVVVWPVGAGKSAVCRGDFVLAPTLLAVVTVVVQNEACNQNQTLGGTHLRRQNLTLDVKILRVALKWPENGHFQP